MSSPSTAQGPNPIPKRAHKKSRGGCHTCKRRKVKCDEKRPLCSNCARRFNDIEACDFGLPGKYLIKKNTTRSGSDATPRRRRPPASPETSLTIRPTGVTTTIPKMRTLELRLFYHFTTTTANILPLSETRTVLPLWAVDTPQLSFDHEHLLYVVLGAAALHMHILNSTDGTMLQTARHYFVQALQKHREEVSHVDAGNAEASVVASMLLSIMVRLLPRHIQGTFQNEPYTLPFERFAMTKGMRTLLYAAFPHIQGSKVLDAIYSWPPNPSSPDSPFLDRRLMGYPHSMKKLPELRLPPDLRNLTISDDGPTVDPNIAAITLPLTTTSRSDPDHRVYSLLTAYLLTIYRAIVSNEPIHWVRRRVEAMIVFTPSAEFVMLLQMNDPRSLAILARFFALSSAVEGVWWLDGMGAWETRGIVGNMPPGWEWLTEWPMRVIEEGLIPFQDPTKNGEEFPAFQPNRHVMTGYDMNDSMRIDETLKSY